MARRPKLDDAPACKGKDCHDAIMKIIEKHGAIYFFKCPKCGYMLSSCYVKDTAPAMKAYMTSGKKKEAPK